jgi:hypothetical protein
VHDLFRFPEDGRFAFSREWADVKLLDEQMDSHSGDVLLAVLKSLFPEYVPSG